MNNEFKKIDYSKVVLNFEKCKFLGEIHKELKEKFGLPDYYGANWDALWDCLDGLFDCESKVEIIGYNELSEELREECKIMLDVFDDIKEEYENFSYSIIS